MFRQMIGAILAGVMGVSVADAAPLDRFTSFHVFGDSLSDPGNLFALTGRPASPYFDGRYSNGPVWAEHLAASFAARGLSATNAAIGGAKAGGPQPLDPLFPIDVSVGGQVARFAAALPANPTVTLGTRPLAAIWAGANDLFAAIGGPDVETAARTAADAVGLHAMTLVAGGITDLLIPNLPDLSLTPAYQLFRSAADRADARLATLAFNARLDDQIGALRAAGANVRSLDISALFGDLIANPFAFGLLDARVPCVIPGVYACTPAEANLLAFFDPVHPNAVVHQTVANRATAALAPVPVAPAMALLLTALAGLAGLHRARHRRAI